MIPELKAGPSRAGDRQDGKAKATTSKLNSKVNSQWTSLGQSSALVAKGLQKIQGGRGRWTGVDSRLAHGLELRGFRRPTPIQKSSLPLALAQPPRDILGMARTGSGKTLAYMIPLLQRMLLSPSSSSGIKALILCPTRELATQIAAVGKDLARSMYGRKTLEAQPQPLKWAVIIGGDHMESQFERMESRPDIVVATPGRMLHLMTEMSLDMRTVDMVVYDEADRLFEMGFETQIREILHRLPPTRTSFLFSATLPSKVAEFAKAGLVNPTMVRLDTDNSVSPDLTMRFAAVRPADKDAALLLLVDYLLSERKEETQAGGEIIVFAATKHHVEYLARLLSTAGYPSTYIYGSLDQVARQKHLRDFRAGVSSILLVTDVAARGLDIPMISSVINYDFPPGARNFVHRVGRTARAGRSGTAWSLVTPSEVPYLADLDMALGLSIADSDKMMYGSLPQEDLQSRVEAIETLSQQVDGDLRTLRQVKDRGQAMYERSRVKATAAGFRQGRDWGRSGSERFTHDLRISASDTASRFAEPSAHQSLLKKVEGYRPEQSALQLTRRGPQSFGRHVTQNSRITISSNSKPFEHAETAQKPVVSKADAPPRALARKSFADHSFYLSNEGSSTAEDNKFSIAMPVDLRSAAFDLVNDEDRPQKAQKASQLRWDRKKKKYVKGPGAAAEGMIRGESGALLPASFKSGRYAAWRGRASVGVGKGQKAFRPTAASGLVTLDDTRRKRTSTEKK